MLRKIFQERQMLRQMPSGVKNPEQTRESPLLITGELGIAGLQNGLLLFLMQLYTFCLKVRLHTLERYWQGSDHE